MKYLHVNSKKNVRKFNKLCKKEEMLVYYYGTHCMWCKKLDPTWKQLKKSVSHKKGILVKLNKDFIDRTKCLHTVYTVPTILFLNKGGLEEMYEGDRSLASLLDFIEVNFSIKTLKKSRRKGKRRKGKRSRRKGKRSRRRGKRRRGKRTRKRRAWR